MKSGRDAALPKEMTVSTDAFPNLFSFNSKSRSLILGPNLFLEVIKYQNSIS